jgi:hypothetical protein
MISGAAFADDIHVVFDPSTPIMAGSFGLITQTNTPYLVSWSPCSSPGIDNQVIAQQQACLLFLNETGAPIKDLQFSFTANEALAGQTIGCDSVDEFLTANTCGAVQGTLSPGELVTVNFFGGQSIGTNMAFFFGETGVDLADAPPITISVPTPEPGTLVLMLAGFAVVAFSLLRKSAA